MNPIVLFEGQTGIALILSTAGTILTSILTFLSQLTTWILGDDIAVMFFAIMIIMLALHVLKSLVKGAS